MAINAKLVDTKPTIQEFKNLTKCLDGVMDYFEEFSESIPKSFASRLNSSSESIITLTSTLDKLGKGLKNITAFGRSGFRVLDNLSKPDAKGFSEINRVLEQFNTSVQGIDLTHLTAVNTSLRRLGESMANISKYGLTSAQTLHALGAGFMLTEETKDGFSAQKIPPVSEYLKELTDSFQKDFGDFNVEDSGLFKVSKLLASFSRGFVFFNRNVEQLTEKLNNKELLRQLKQGVSYFISEFSPITMELNSMRERISDKYEGGSLSLTTKTMAFDDVISFIKGIVSSSKKLVDYVNSGDLVDFALKVGPEIKTALSSFFESVKGISVALQSVRVVSKELTQDENSSDTTYTTTKTLQIDGIVSLLRSIVNSSKGLIDFVNSDEFKSINASTGTRIKVAMEALMRPLTDASAVFRQVKEVYKSKTSDEEEGTSLSTTTTEVQKSFEGILSLMRAIVNSSKQLVNFLDSDEFKSINSLTGTRIKSAFENFVEPLTAFKAVFESITSVSKTAADKETGAPAQTVKTVEKNIFDMLNFMRAIVNSSKQLVNFISSPEYKTFTETSGTEIAKAMSAFSKAFDGIGMTFTSSRIASSNKKKDKELGVITEEYETIDVSIDKIVNIMSKMSNSIRRIIELSKMPEVHNFQNTMTPVVTSIEEFVSRMNQVSLKDSFGGFERLANAMYKISEASKNVVTGVSKAERALRKYSETTNKATRITNWFVGGWRSVVNAFTGGTVIYTIVRSIRDAVNAFVEFDKKLRMINTLAGMSETSLRNLGREVINTSGKFGLDLGQAADSMFAIQSATLRGTDALRVFNAAAMLSVAGGADLKNSTELVTRSIMAYNKHTTEAQHIADVLFKVQDRGITTIEELSHNLTKVIPSAVAARVSFEEVGAAMATLTTKGLQTTVASTALNSMILKLTAGSEKLDAVFQRLGYDSSSTALKQKGLEFVMRQISAATGGSANELQKLGFNYRDIKAAAILANDSTGFFAETLKYINSETEEGGKALQAYNEVCKSLSQQVAQLVATFRGAIVGVAEFVAKWSGLKVVLGLLNSFVQVKSDFNSLVGAFKSIAGPLLQVITGFSLISGSVIIFIGAISKLKAILSTLNFDAIYRSIHLINKDSGIFARGFKKVFDVFERGSAVFARYWFVNQKVASANRVLREATEELTFVQENYIKGSARYVAAENAKAAATAQLTKEQKRAAAASFALKNSFKAFAKSSLILLIIAAVYKAVSMVWDQLKENSANKNVRSLRQEFDSLVGSIDDLKTVTQVDSRIEKLSARLEDLSKMKQTSSVKKLTKEYQEALDALNKKKLDLQPLEESGDAFLKLEEARKKLTESVSDKFSEFFVLESENKKLVKQLNLLPKATSAWAKLATKITENVIKMRQLSKEMKGLFSFIPEVYFNKLKEKYGESITGITQSVAVHKTKIKQSLYDRGFADEVYSDLIKAASISKEEFADIEDSYEKASLVQEQIAERLQETIRKHTISFVRGDSVKDVISDMVSIGVNAELIDSKIVSRNLESIINIIQKLKNTYKVAQLDMLSGEDHYNELMKVHQERLQAIIDLYMQMSGSDLISKDQLKSVKASLSQFKTHLSLFEEIKASLDKSHTWTQYGTNKSRADFETFLKNTPRLQAIVNKWLSKEGFTYKSDKLFGLQGIIRYPELLSKTLQNAIKEYLGTITPQDIFKDTVGGIIPKINTKGVVRKVETIPIPKGALTALSEYTKLVIELQQQMKKLKDIQESFDPLHIKSVELFGSVVDKINLKQNQIEGLRKIFDKSVLEGNTKEAEEVGQQILELFSSIQQMQKEQFRSVKAVPVSEQVSLGSKEAYDLLYKQTQNNTQQSIDTHVKSLDKKASDLVKNLKDGIAKAISISEKNAFNVIPAN